MSSVVGGVSERDALILKLWNAGVTRQAIRNRLGCGSVAIERALATQAAQGRWVAPRRGPREAMWTPERIEQARRMWLAGDSAAKIGRALEVSRGAVTGKLTRLGVVRAETVAVRLRRPAAEPAERAAAIEPAPQLRPHVPGVEEPPATTDLLGLGAHMCRWPIGEPDAAGFGFCGRPAKGAYCETHRRRAYSPEPLEPIEAVAGLKPERPAGRERPAPAVFDGWARR
jgi:GcrA cell cycle regulator